MPPAVSDESGASDVDSSTPVSESSNPKRARRGRKPRAGKGRNADEDMDEVPPAEASMQNGGDEDEDEDEDEEAIDEDEYVVEKICSHMIDKEGEPKFEVKWEGYDKKSERTWESEDNLRTNASQILDDYLDSIGGRDRLFEETAKAVKTKKRGRPSTGTPNASAPAKRSRRMDQQPDDEQSASSKAAQWKPPAGSWEDHIAHLDACKDEADGGKLIVYITWKNGHKTQHGTKIVYQRCPQKMLQFYEQHVKIVGREPDGADAAEVAVDATTRGGKNEHVDE